MARGNPETLLLCPVCGQPVEGYVMTAGRIIKDGYGSGSWVLTGDDPDPPASMLGGSEYIAWPAGDVTRFEPCGDTVYGDER